MGDRVRGTALFLNDCKKQSAGGLCTTVRIQRDACVFWNKFAVPSYKSVSQV